MTTCRAAARLLAAPTAASLLVLGAAGAASAHVTVTPSTTEAGAYSVLTFSNGHGCEGSPTTRITISIPEQINAVTPTLHPTWEVEKNLVELDEPVTDAPGNTVTERVGTVVYTAQEPQPDGFRESFSLSVKLPETAGETLVFPVVQSCEEGENGWIEVPADGQDAHELDSPAPALTITEAGSDGHAASAETSAPAASAEATSAEATSAGNALGIAGLVAGLLGLLAGGTALVRVRRQP
ncbi:YcnI family protein [Nocardioides sp.]|uniref:YcnI family copper-binding membrane protein n=1 Tax=Nocardioides sp. TaxID=35761 RepID=UPI0027347412|nr:YcnI family protein [Nocardioides sp.]MDP3892634.1 YcnI family protein [Nocardioides sp.]